MDFYPEPDLSIFYNQQLEGQLVDNDECHQDREGAYPAQFATKRIGAPVRFVGYCYSNDGRRKFLIIEFGDRRRHEYYSNSPFLDRGYFLAMGEVVPGRTRLVANQPVTLFAPLQISGNLYPAGSECTVTSSRTTMRANLTIQQQQQQQNAPLLFAPVSTIEYQVRLVFHELTKRTIWYRARPIEVPFNGQRGF